MIFGQRQRICYRWSFAFTLYSDYRKTLDRVSHSWQNNVCYCLAQKLHIGKLVEKQGRKAMDLRKPASMIAKLLFGYGMFK